MVITMVITSLSWDITPTTMVKWNPHELSGTAPQNLSHALGNAVCGPLPNCKKPCCSCGCTGFTSPCSLGKCLESRFSMSADVWDLMYAYVCIYSATWQHGKGLRVHFRAYWVCWDHSDQSHRDVNDAYQRTQSNFYVLLKEVMWV